VELFLLGGEEISVWLTSLEASAKRLLSFCGRHANNSPHLRGYDFTMSFFMVYYHYITIKADSDKTSGHHVNTQNKNSCYKFAQLFINISHRNLNFSKTKSKWLTLSWRASRFYGAAFYPREHTVCAAVRKFRATNETIMQNI
jgi:hypothetical protein